MPAEAWRATGPELAYTVVFYKMCVALNLEFLRVASRPIMGKAKARQSAGQKALDLTKQLKNLDDLDMGALLRADGAELKRRGVPVQERKRLLKFTDKYVQGYRHDGRGGKHAWKGFLPPYKQTTSPLYVAHTGMRPYNNHVDPPAAAATPEAPGESVAPPVDVLLREWVDAKRARDAATAERLRDEMRAVGIDPVAVRPSVHPEDDAPPETQARIAQWVAAHGRRDYATADRLRDELRALGIEPSRAAYPHGQSRRARAASRGAADGEGE